MGCKAGTLGEYPLQGVSVGRISEEDLDSFLTSLTAAADYDTFLKVWQGLHFIGPFVTSTLCQLFGQLM